MKGLSKLATVFVGILLGACGSTPGDEQGPSLAFVDLAETLSRNQTITVSATDDSGVARVEFYDDGVLKVTDTEAPYTYKTAYAVEDNGTHNLRVVAYDGAGNRNELARKLNVSIPVPDVLAPKVNLSVKVSRGTLSDILTTDKVTLQADALDDQGVSYVEFYDNGAIIKVISKPPYELSRVYATDSETPLGKHVLKAVAYDAAGNKGESSTVTINVLAPASPDVTPPTATLSLSPDTLTQEGTVTLTSGAADDRSVARVDFYDNGQLIGTSTTAPFDFLKSYAAAQNGQHTIKAVVTDASGNVGESSATLSVNIPVQVINDTTKPTLTLVATPGTLTQAGTVRLSTGATDNRAVARVDFYDNGQLIGTTTTEPFAFTRAYTAAHNGQHAIKAVATDTSGNVAESSATVTVNIQ